MNKTCTRCKVSKLMSTEFFYYTKNTRSQTYRFSSWCIDCAKESARESEQRRILDDPEKFYAARKRQGRSQKLRKYGIDENIYDSLLETQHGLCGICKSDNAKRNGHDVFIIDHCHKTGKVRGLLCHKCNVAIGMVDDDPGVLEMAAAYIRRLS